MKELETDLPWFLLNQEQIGKGDRVFEDGRRIIFMTTDYHLDILARAPGWWDIQDNTIFVDSNLHRLGPSLFFSLHSILFCSPARQKERVLRRNVHDDARMSWEGRDLELSVTFFMSDFECSIRDNFVSHFPQIEPKGTSTSPKQDQASTRSRSEPGSQFRTSTD